MAFCLIGTHNCVRGLSLVLDLFAVDSQHPYRIVCVKRARKPLRYFLFFLCLCAVGYVVTARLWTLSLGGKRKVESRILGNTRGSHEWRLLPRLFASPSKVSASETQL